MSPQPLTNFKIQRYYQNEPRFNAVYSRDNLPNNIKDGAWGAYLMNILIFELIGLLYVH